MKSNGTSLKLLIKTCGMISTQNITTDFESYRFSIVIMLWILEMVIVNEVELNDFEMTAFS